MNALGELIRSGVVITVIGILTGMLFYTGFGISGSIFIWLFAVLISVFVWMALFQDHEHIELNYRKITWFTCKTLLILGLYVCYISIIDYYLVELIKLLNLPLENTVYWKVFFGGLVPASIVVWVYGYYSASNHLSNAIRILILSVFILNSNLNDFLYYLFFGKELPERWTWLIQPKFMFGESFTSLELSFWTLGAILMGLIGALFPWEILVANILDSTYDFKKSKKAELIESFVLLVILVVGSVFLMYTRNFIIDNLQTLEKQLISRTTNPKSETGLGAWQALALRTELTSIYERTGAYPISTGNCIDNWDSPLQGLPWEVTSISLENYKSSECNFTPESSGTLLYFSDGTRYALLLDGTSVGTTHPNLYTPRVRDVFWFDSSTDSFWQTWSWDSNMLVYMIDSEKEVTRFELLQST
jgi:hypothetical protein